MDPSVREDYLESLCNLESERGSPAAIRDLAAFLDRDVPSVTKDILELAGTGDLLAGEDGMVTLTVKGRQEGMRVVRKHRILECFFTEMLGMEPDAASRDACVLEHDIPDEAVLKLKNLISGCPPGNCAPCARRGWNRALLPTLLDVDEGSEVIVRDLMQKGRLHRLADLGILPGEHIVLRRRLSNRSVVVEVKGADIALSAEIAGMVLVEKSP
ncbi:DtxR family Mn-dependent transcriptional regulator [Methanolinea mesophila]|uniref:metal-dependent transcriptional regulator n=1 Tax=Methanolinea mesophila TaxID=547055 RepID=UPI001AE2398D|nr:metal-dependent transcriptional regulator [Methanolinea mesophila]MBP1927643.1 DtxR family Mn-dependent transcriptional regulator [Methanolinea mesophila]